MKTNKPTHGFMDGWMNGFLGWQPAAGLAIYPSIHSSNNPFSSARTCG
jgi:hypothetical protein